MNRAYFDSLQSLAPGEASRIEKAREMEGKPDDFAGGEAVTLCDHEREVDPLPDEIWWLRVDSRLVGDRAENGHVRPTGIEQWLERHGVPSSPPWPHFDLATDMLGMIRQGAIRGQDKARERARELREA